MVRLAAAYDRLRASIDQSVDAAADEVGESFSFKSKPTAAVIDDLPQPDREIV